MYDTTRSPAAIDPTQWGLHLAHGLMSRALTRSDLTAARLEPHLAALQLPAVLGSAFSSQPVADESEDREPDPGADVDDDIGCLDENQPELPLIWVDARPEKSS